MQGWILRGPVKGTCPSWEWGKGVRRSFQRQKQAVVKGLGDRALVLLEGWPCGLAAENTKGYQEAEEVCRS